MNKNQVYIDPIFIKGNILNVYLWWDYKTRIELRIEFLNRKILGNNRFKQIAIVQELMRRSGIDFILTRDEFINIQFNEFPTLKIETVKLDF